ncbi:Tail fiber protein [Mannheimia varigena USDA-ARS-USMARC-1296]|uniref:Tail fiber protein n=1 Tax=Mannheimia varigena USDA-ARS-USMARC-1296 TaxID=1433287 RepID=W0Q995_9PAST|nr:tail fiber protein [Mannheimia varigena]AHG75454.1 Tail fiber protein [Mannheimia varigena USDA-ARS-USMARC-1296]
MLQPKLLSKIWAGLGLKNTIPETRTDDLAQGAATYEEGFPQITMTPIAQGGKAPSGKDMNGVLNELSAHIVHLNKGGLYKFDITFAGKINGYDKGAVLLNDAETAVFVSLVSQNKHNFNTSSDYRKHWAKLADVQSIQHITPLKLTSLTQNKLLPTGHTHEIEKASLTEVGITQLFSGLDSDAENMAATPKAIKMLKDLIDAITRNLGNYIPNSKKSNAVNSNSADMVATSAAVKAANDNANGRVSKSGDTMTGNLSLNNGTDYVSVLHYNSTGKYTLTQGAPDSSPNFYAVAYFNAQGTREYAAFYPKTGNTELIAYQSWVNTALGGYIPNSKKSNSVTSNSADTVATSLAAKNAYDKGVEAKTAADNAQRTANAKQSPATTLSGYGITDGAVAKSLTTENLNAVTAAGLYGQNANVNATSQRNYPDTKAGALQVIDSAYGVMQIYTTWDTKNVFVRNQQPGDWSDWVRVDGLDRLPLTGGTLLGNLVINSGDWSKVELFNKANKRLILEVSPDSINSIGSIVYRNASDSNEALIGIPRQNGTMALIGDIANTVKSSVSRSNKSRTNTFPLQSGKSYSTVGSVTIYPDGRIIQIMHLKNIKPVWFNLEDTANTGDRHRTINIPLWTAMPNKIIDVSPKTIRASNNAVTYYTEAGEWISAWQIYGNDSNKSSVNINISRFRGANDEDVDLYVVVEGY